MTARDASGRMPWGGAREPGPAGRGRRPCRWGRLASAYVDGELGPRACRALEAHLAGCPGCRRAVAAFGALDRALDQALACPPPPPELVDVLEQALAPGRAGGPAPKRALSPALRPALVNWALAAVGAVAFSLALEAISAVLGGGPPGAGPHSVVAAARAAVASLPPDQAAGWVGRGFFSLTAWLLGLAGWLGAL